MQPGGTLPHWLFHLLHDTLLGLPCAESLALLCAKLKTDPGETHRGQWYWEAETVLLPRDLCFHMAHLETTPHSWEEFQAMCEADRAAGTTSSFFFFL